MHPWYECELNHTHALSMSFQCPPLMLSRPCIKILSRPAPLDTQRLHRLPADATDSANAVSMLGHRLRRWPSFKTTMGEFIIFAEVYISNPQAFATMLFYCWASVADDRPIITQHRMNKVVLTWKHETIT